MRARGPLRTQMRAAARRRGRATEGPRQAQARRAKRAELRNEKKRTKTNESGKEADVRAWITYVYVCTVDTHCKTSQVLYCNVSHLSLAILPWILLLVSRSTFDCSIRDEIRHLRCGFSVALAIAFKAGWVGFLKGPVGCFNGFQLDARWQG